MTIATFRLVDNACDSVPLVANTNVVWPLFARVLLRLNNVSAGIVISQKASQSPWELLELIWGMFLSAELRVWQFRRDMSVGGSRVV